MSEERKKINQCLSFTGNITISELVSSIPNDFRGVVEISEGDLIITDEDVLNFGYKDIRLFNELRINNGYLKQEISDDLKKEDRAILLIISGDLLCKESILIPDFGLDVRGVVAVLGKELKAKSIEITEDLYCYGNIDILCDIDVKGDLKASGGISSKHSINVRGNLSSAYITTYDITVRGDVFVSNEGLIAQGNVNVKGNLECSNDIEANNINVRENLICNSSILLNGRIYVGGNLESDTIIANGDVIINGQAEVRERILALSYEVRIRKLYSNSISIECGSLQIG